MPPRTYPLKICTADEPENVIKSFNFPLRADSYYTILVTQLPNAPLAVEVIDDTPDPTKVLVNQLTVRQYSPNFRVQVSVGELHTDIMEAGGKQTLDGLPDGFVPITGRIDQAGGTLNNWHAQADFHSSHHATLLVLPDVRGFIRPRVTVDGPSLIDGAKAVTESPTPPAAMGDR